MKIRSYRSLVAEQERPSVRGHHVEPGIVAQAEVLLRDRGHHRVDLHPVDLRIGIENPERAAPWCPPRCPGSRSSCRSVQQRGHRQEHVPLSTGENGVRLPHAVDGKALVEVEVARGAVLHHLDELVSGLFLVDGAGGRLHGSRRKRHQTGQNHGHPQPAHTQNKAAGGRDQSGGAQESTLRPYQRDRHQGWEEGPQETPGSRNAKMRPAVEPARRDPGCRCGWRTE